MPPFPRQSNSPTQQLFLSLSTLFPSHPAPLHAHPHPPLTPVWGLCFIVVLHLAGNPPPPLHHHPHPCVDRGRSPTACERQASATECPEKERIRRGHPTTNELCQDLKVLVLIPISCSFSCLFSSFLIKKEAGFCYSVMISATAALGSELKTQIRCHIRFK